MFKNYITTAFRNLLRNKSYTIINVLGLSLGIACSLVLFLVIRHELSYDRFHAKADRIYRINSHITRGGQTHHMPATPAPMANTVRNDVAGVEKVTFVHYANSGLVKVTGTENTSANDKLYREESGIAYIDPDYFDIFDIQWKEGNANVLKDPYSVVLSEALAEKYFGDKPALGQVLLLNNTIKAQVNGVIANPPANTDLPFSLMISQATRKAEGQADSSWGGISSSHSVFVLLADGQTPESINTQFGNIREKYLAKEDRKIWDFELQSLSSIHYDNRYGNFNYRVMEKETLWALGLIGLGLLVAACINFINMATAQAMKRSREVGVRKVLGSSRQQLFWQFMGETTIISLVAVLISMFIAELVLPSLSEMLGLAISINLADPVILLFLVLTCMVVSFLSGAYPALTLSGYEPVRALKGKINTTGTGSMSLRRGLVIAQFSISQALIIGTIIVANQMELFRNTSLGFDKEAIITVPLPQSEPAKLNRMRDGLVLNPGVQKFTFGFTSAASQDRWVSIFRFKSANGIAEHQSDMRPSDINFLDTYGIELLAGRNLAESDTMREALINETMARKLGFANPADAVDKKLLHGRGNKELPIVGVVKDFNFLPLNEEMNPVVLTTDQEGYQEASIKIHPQNAQATIAAVQELWQQVYPDYLFSHQFLDERLEQFYRDQARMAGLFKIFTGIGIFIGCLGLYGLVSFMASQRTKEIGIRKVLGASSANIVYLFSKEYARLLLVAFVIAAPLAWYVMNQWLNDFAYRIDVGPSTFASAGLVTLLIATATVGVKSVKTAMANPVKSLRSE
jgi:putative ABC transport system permease protein